jgi:hypothetical protein
MTAEQAKALAGMGNLSQPAKLWLSDLMKVLGSKMTEGGDPSIDIEMGPVLLEIRVIRIEGHFERHRVDVEVEAP